MGTLTTKVRLKDSYICDPHTKSAKVPCGSVEIELKLRTRPKWGVLVTLCTADLLYWQMDAGALVSGIVPVTHGIPFFTTFVMTTKVLIVRME